MTVFAFYDLAVSPVSFDIMHFLIGARGHAKSFDKGSGEDIHVVIVPGPDRGFKQDDHKPLSHAEKTWRVEHILMPCCALFGTAVTRLTRREDARIMTGGRVYPQGWRIGAPQAGHFLNIAVDAMKAGILPAFQASGRAREHVARWLKYRPKPVTITL